MIIEHFKDQILYQFTGIREATLKEQLDEFNTVKRSLFVHYTRSKKTIINSLITASGYIPNQVSSGTIHNHFMRDSLFIPL